MQLCPTIKCSRFISASASFNSETTQIINNFTVLYTEEETPLNKTANGTFASANHYATLLSRTCTSPSHKILCLGGGLSGQLASLEKELAGPDHPAQFGITINRQKSTLQPTSKLTCPELQTDARKRTLRTTPCNQHLTELIIVVPKAQKHLQTITGYAVCLLRATGWPIFAAISVASGDTYWLRWVPMTILGQYHSSCRPDCCIQMLPGTVAGLDQEHSTDTFA